MARATYESWASSPAVRLVMRANRKRDTKPEIALRSAIHRAGLRFRITQRVDVGAPVVVDILFRRAKVAVFVDGCYWHGCPLHGTSPRTNPGYWIPKIARNRERDIRIDDLLTRAGWLPIRVWEHEEFDQVVPKVVSAVRRRAHLSVGEGEPRRPVKRS